eukprot:TRINITY_DN68679_c0_g1_i1.p1 TRINITY_DN68679_c0_g1~~TRINITY_DN68679_c0_g1_i1.p1  ORF type:complete len:253 (+),score=61.49 TRINITY_DN68679_c0_g1_i1:114-761(+)
MVRAASSMGSVSARPLKRVTASSLFFVRRERFVVSALPPVCQSLRQFAQSADGKAAEQETAQPPGGIPNPAQVFEQIQDTAQKVGSSAGLPTSLEEAQATLQKLKSTVEERIPAMSSLGSSEEVLPQKVSQSLMSVASAGAVLLRIQGDLKPEEEQKLVEVLPAPFVAGIKKIAPAIPKDPQLELMESVVRRLDTLQTELAELKQEIAKAKEQKK